MLSYAESTISIVIAVAGALLLVAALYRFWPLRSRKQVNDVTGWQLGILGTTYAVILGFMLFTEWTDFRTAEIDANLEATSLLHVYRMGAGLPSPEREALQGLAMKYADAAVNQDWPAMQRQEVGDASARVGGEMWALVTGLKADSVTAANSADHLTDAMANLMERRNLREQEREIRLPGLLWILLVAGGGATVGSACLLGNDNKWLHYFQVLMLAFVVSVTLATIADLARPFEGGVAVSPIAFQRALVVMRQGTSR